jgi:RNA ligase (TIGR02306 family)
MRKLVTVRKINNISPIEGADAIECIQVDGWQVVAQKGLYNVDDYVLYFEIDSFLPESDSRFESFMKFGVTTFNGVRGHRVKTKRLRGVYSQGIIVPVSEFNEIGEAQIDTDYAELLGVCKWERPDVAGAKEAAGAFPSFLVKSDQERIQNIYHKLVQSDEQELDFVPTLKMDGSSITVFAVTEEYINPDKLDSYRQVGNWYVGYCSRNLQLKFPQEDETPNSFWLGAQDVKLFEKVVALAEYFDKPMAIQGELVGPKIQGGFEKYENYTVFAYNIFDIVDGEFTKYVDFATVTIELNIQRVPLMGDFQKILKKPLHEIIAAADGKGLRAPYREGIVWKALRGNRQFKVISNKYLAKEQ